MNTLGRVALALVLLGSAPISRADDSGWTLVGQVGGSVWALATAGNLAYVGSGLRLTVLDVTDPSSMVEMGVTTPMPHFVRGVAVDGDHAYVAAGAGGLRVVDVGDPSRPTEVGAWDSPGFAEGVAVSGDTAYLADGPYGLRIVDVSDPSRPREVAWAYAFDYAYDVAVAGHYAFVAAAGAGLLVVDVADPAHPVERARIAMPGYAYGVAIIGTTVLVADAWGGLRIVDAGDPGAAFEKAVFATPGWALDVDVGGTTAVVADSVEGLRVVDVADPSHPNEVGSVTTTGRATKVSLSGSFAFVADERAGLSAYDLNDAPSPVEVGAFGAGTDARNLVVVPPYAYVASGLSGLRIIDVSDPERPREVAFVVPGGFVTSVQVGGHYAYLGCIDPLLGLLVVDVGDPLHPRFVGSFPDAFGEIHDLRLVGTRLYLAMQWGVVVVDVSNPETPTFTGVLDFWTDFPDYYPDYYGEAVSIDGSIGYFADSHGGVAIVDLSDASAPRLIHLYHPNPPELVRAVAAANGRLYLGGGGKLWTADVSNPAEPEELGSVSFQDEVWRITVAGDDAWVSNQGPGLEIVDVTEPSDPRIVDSFDTPGRAFDVVLEGGLAYVADGPDGLLVLRREDAGLGSDARRKSEQENGLGPRQVAASAKAQGPFASTHTTFGHRRARGAATPPPATNHAPASRLDRTLVAGPGSTGNTCTVTSAGDSGSGTLRSCLQTAEGGDTITFDPTVFPPSNPVMIVPESELPDISKGGITIDGSNAGVILSGKNVTSDASVGLNVFSDSNRIIGLQIRDWKQCAIRVTGAANVIGGDRSEGGGPTGQGNVLSGNGDGVILTGDAAHNHVVGNLIGTDATGRTAMGNTAHGVAINTRASFNVIGGDDPRDRNVISGNGEVGIICGGFAVGSAEDVENTIVGNYIGTDITGTFALGNGSEGIAIVSGCDGTRIGGALPSERNVISGNGQQGVHVALNAKFTWIRGNYVGTDVTGMIALGNGQNGNGYGIHAEDGPIGTVIGGPEPGEGNRVSGNSWVGVAATGFETTETAILGNWIGLDASGENALPNGGDGIFVWESDFNRIGGSQPGEGNVVVGSISSSGSRALVIVGNRIGTNAPGTRPLAPGGYFYLESTDNHLGGSTAAEKNTIVGNGVPGGVAVDLTSPRAEHNWIMGNLIGVAADGRTLCGFAQAGIVAQSSSGNVIQRNLVAGNGQTGILIREGSIGNVLRANLIGALGDGTIPGSNGESDVDIRGADTRVGGVYPGDGNILAFSPEGVIVSGSPGNVIRGNSIHSHAGRGIDLRGGNEEIAAPVIAEVTWTTVSGTACAGCTVDVYSDDGDEGRFWEGTTTAGAGGAFTFASTGVLRGPNVTATATDSRGNTSVFSAPVERPRSVRRRATRRP